MRNKKWIIEKIGNLFYFKIKTPKKKKRKNLDYLQYKDQAYSIVKDRLEYFNQFYNYKWTNIVIRNQKTRWGSCSRSGNLNFNYKIALITKEAADYIIVHELCHLGEFNHSKNFWDLVEKTVPDYKKIRSDLRNNKLIQG